MLYDTTNGVNILTGSTDPDVNDPRYLIQVNGVDLPDEGDWPYDTVTSLGIAVRVYRNGVVQLDAAANDDHPQDGSRKLMGTITAQASDGTDPSNVPTYNVYLTAYATPPSPSGLSTDNVVEDWNPDAGLSVTVNDVTGWTEQANSVAATVQGVPTRGTPPGGTANYSVVIAPGSHLTATDLSNMPVSNSPRCLQAVVKFVNAIGNWGGVGHGALADNGAYSIIQMPDGMMAFDYGNARVLSGIYPAGLPFITHVNFDGTNAYFWIGKVLVATAPLTLITGSTQINLGRSFGGNTTEMEIYRKRTIEGAMPYATIMNDVDELNALYIGDLTLADHSAGTASLVNAGGFTYDGAAVNTCGYMVYSVKEGAAPDEDELIAGTGSVDFGVIPLTGDTAYQIVVDTALDDTDYKVYTQEYNLVGGKSNIIASDTITTSSATSSPTAITPTSINLTEDTAIGAVIANFQADQPGCTFSEIADPSNKFAVAGGGTGTLTGALLASASPYSLTVRADNGNTPHDQVIPINVSLAVASDYTPDVVVSTRAAAQAQINAWIAAPTSPPPGKTVNDKWVVAIDQPTSGAWAINGHNASTIPGGIVLRGVGPYTDNPTFPYRPVSGSDVSGDINFSNCNNIQIALISCRKLQPNGNVNCSDYKVSQANDWSTTPSSPSGVTGITPQNNTGYRTEKGYHAGFQAYLLNSLGNNPNMQILRSFWTFSSSDLIKFNGNATDNNWTVRGNWWGRQAMAGAIAHTDAFQSQNNHISQNMLFEKNFHMEGLSLHRPSTQEFFRSQPGGSVAGTIQRQNAFFSSAASGLNFGGDLIEYNTLAYCEAGAHGSIQGNVPATGNVMGMLPPTIGGAATKRYNVASRTKVTSSDTSGTGGIILTIGAVNDTLIPANMSQYPTYFEGFPGHTTYIDAIKPVAGSPLHWAYGGQKVGAWELMEDLFVNHDHLINDGWPTAGPASREYAPIGTAAYTEIGSTWTGNYDANGENA